jgi:hypothetical protein
MKREDKVSSQLLRRVRFAGLAGVALAHVAFADPPAETQRLCEAANPREAAALADKLFARAEYQHAGACYQVAGDMAHANLAYLKASGPQGEDTARALKAQGDAAKALFASVGHALRKDR